MNERDLEFYILVNDKRVTEYNDKNGYTFIEGRKGSNFEIEIINKTALYKKVVISVDGTNILTGDQVWDVGYEIAPYSPLIIPGWRINKNQVANFVFENVKGAYSSKTSSIGVIGFMVFEQKSNVFSKPIWVASGNNLRCSTAVGGVNNEGINNIGIGWGDQQNFNTVKSSIDYEKNNIYTTAIYYDDIKGLERRGIVVKKYENYQNPFPTDFGCKPPR